jgi:hypothetical protein
MFKVTKIFYALNVKTLKKILEKVKSSSFFLLLYRFNSKKIILKRIKKNNPSLAWVEGARITL